MIRGAAAWIVLCTLAAGCGGDGEGAPVAGSRAAQLVTPAIPARDGDLFEDVTAAAGIDFVHDVGDDAMDNVIEAIGAGGAWFDADGDGDLDLYLVQQGWRARVSSGERPAAAPANRLYRNRGDGTFEDVGAGAGVADTGYGFGAVAADFDADGHTDLYVLNDGANRLFRNRGDGSFEDVTARAGVGGDACSVAGTALDADGDGTVDIYVGNYAVYDPDYQLHYSPDVFPGPLAFEAQPDVLYLNSGDGTFREAGAESGILVPGGGRSMGVAAADFDGDGRTDVFVANDMTANFLFLNRGGARFEECAVSSGVAFGVQGEATGAMAAAVGDFDGDGLPDLHVTDPAYGSLYRSLGSGLFEDRIAASGVATLSGPWVSWGTGFVDYDDDGRLDLHVVNGDMHRATGRPDLLLANVDGQRFEPAGDRGGACFAAEVTGRGEGVVDFDDDGRQDLFVTTIGDRPLLLRNRANSPHHWVTLRLRGAGGNTDGLGAVVTLEAGGRRWVRQARAESGYLVQGDGRLHFGLGAAASVERLEVRWPGGPVQTYAVREVDRFYVLSADGTMQ